MSSVACIHAAQHALRILLNVLICRVDQPCHCSMPLFLHAPPSIAAFRACQVVPALPTRHPADWFGLQQCPHEIRASTGFAVAAHRMDHSSNNITFRACRTTRVAAPPVCHPTSHTHPKPTVSSTEEHQLLRARHGSHAGKPRPL